MIENIFIATVSQNYMDQAFNELLNIDKDLKLMKQYQNGIMILRPGLEKESFNKMVVEKNPMFTRHINATDYSLEISEKIDLDKIANTIRNYKASINAGDKIGVQIRKAKGEYDISPTEIKEELDKILMEEMNAIPQTKDPEKIISILLAEDSCYIGLSKASDNLSSWSGGMVHYKKDFLDVSRAKFKLMEAISVFHLDLSDVKTALDLGAAPGGWTSVLLEHGIAVTAVDTGDMDKRLFANPNFTFIKANSAELNLENGTIFDMITSDMSWNPSRAATMVNSASKYLKTDGIAIITVKLMSDKVMKSVKEVMKRYSEVFEIIGGKQLFHNRDEITLYMKKK